MFLDVMLYYTRDMPFFWSNFALATVASCQLCLSPLLTVPHSVYQAAMSGYDVSNIALTMKRKLADERGDGKRARLAEDDDEDALAALADEMEDEVSASVKNGKSLSVIIWILCICWLLGTPVFVDLQFFQGSD
jgi:hypothetical protein